MADRTGLRVEVLGDDGSAVTPNRLAYAVLHRHAAEEDPPRAVIGVPPVETVKEATTSP